MQVDKKVEKDLQKHLSKLTDLEIDQTIENYVTSISKEFRDGFNLLRKYPRSVTFFGSARLTPASSHYHDARKLAARIVKELGYAIVTGGGPGIMEATNQGAQEAQGESIGINITLPHEQIVNPYVIHGNNYNYFFTRKAMLTFSAEAFIFMPGGFGTLDELFSTLTLIQTHKIPNVPVILFGTDFWQPLVDFMRTHMLNGHHAISEEDMELITVTNSMDKVIKIIKEAPVQEWWRSM